MSELSVSHKKAKSRDGNVKGHILQWTRCKYILMYKSRYSRFIFDSVPFGKNMENNFLHKSVWKSNGVTIFQKKSPNYQRWINLIHVEVEALDDCFRVKSDRNHDSILENHVIIIISSLFILSFIINVVIGYCYILVLQFILITLSL